MGIPVSDYHAMRDRLESAGAKQQCPLPSLRKEVPQGTGITQGVRIRQTPKPLMNKLETEFFLFLQRHPGDIKFIRPQSIRFMLGNGIWFKPDFTGFLDGSYSAWEVKGPHAFRGGFENLKVAAHQYTEIHWYLVWKEKGDWKQQGVLP